MQPELTQCTWEVAFGALAYTSSYAWTPLFAWIQLVCRGLLDKIRLCPWESSWPIAISFCLCSLFMQHPHGWLHTHGSSLSPPLTHSSNPSFQSSLHIPNYPTPTTLASKPKLFPTAGWLWSIIQPSSGLNSDCTTPSPPLLCPSIAFFPVSSFSSHCYLSNN